ncbi:long-chain fatty acid--CoA ligase [Caenispirillum salinarum]|uniref:long-chain-fatty-acid--CoA ligase n=1 Tax=Caenispirillum salinarum TaxID=859058 RepID=UPI00384F8663
MSDTITRDNQATPQPSGAGSDPGPASEHVRGAPIVPKPVHALLEETAARAPDAPYLDFLGKKYTYGETWTLVERAAKGFQQLGVGPGVRVGLCLPNTPYYTICYFAILRAGGTVVNYNPLYVERELAYQINDSGTRLMVTLDLKQIYPKVAACLEHTCLERIVTCSMTGALPGVKSILFAVLKRSECAEIPDDLRHVPFEKVIAAEGAPKKPSISPKTDIAVLQYTGGTTGVPKGAMLTHANITANTEQLRRVIPDVREGQEKMLAVLPFFHVFAMTVAQNVATVIGAEIIMLPRFDLAQVMKCIDKKRPTMFPGVPTIYTAINNSGDIKKHDLSSLKICISGGAPLPVEVKNRFEDLTGCALVEGYGLSEASPVVTCNPIGGLVKAGSIGVPLDGTEVQIRDLDGRREEVAQGKKGELCVRGPQVMKGYYNRPEDTDKTIIDGLLHTGDVGYVDSDGYIFLVDRIKDVILAGGYNVYPRAIEEALYLHPAIAECICIGIPDAYRGQAPKCFVTLRDDAGDDVSPEGLREFLTDKVSRIEMPKEIEIRDELPKTMVGKLSRKELVAEEEAKHGEASAT